ncbi:hypothetical protein [Actinomadura rayongensis]|uniref:Uncharacterized protein n=1 Tax=Actinomadura rayongensis TaxID=1429076 RepID=A0A6I4W1C4_9ACTN|nr:hypothetical protein [Actinomadura rayongensis]MXQ64349.1 hypothetical protein [Actinomadura rayongensis]
MVVCGGGGCEVSTPGGIRKPDVFVLPREVARAVILDAAPKIIPGRELLLAAEVVADVVVPVTFDPAVLLEI